VLCALLCFLVLSCFITLSPIIILTPKCVALAVSAVSSKLRKILRNKICKNLQFLCRFVNSEHDGQFRAIFCACRLAEFWHPSILPTTEHKPYCKHCNYSTGQLNTMNTMHVTHSFIHSLISSLTHSLTHSLDSFIHFVSTAVMSLQPVTCTVFHLIKDRLTE